MLHRQLISSFEHAMPPTFEEAAGDAIVPAPPPPLEFADSPSGSRVSFRELLRPRGLSKSCGAADIEREAAIVARAQVYARNPSPDSPRGSPIFEQRKKLLGDPQLQQYCSQVNETLDAFERYAFAL